MKSTSPAQRTLAKLRKEGWLCAITEKWNQYAKVRQVLFGFIDVIAIRGDEMLAIQTTSGSNVAARISKIRALPSAAEWLKGSSRRSIVHGWAKRGGRGERKLWSCRQVEVLAAGEREIAEPFALEA